MKKKDQIIEDYLDYIYDFYNIYDKKYVWLIDFLLKTPFYCTMEEDEDRIEDGRCLRRSYPDYQDYVTVANVIDDLQISVLEVLLELAVRMDGEYVGDPNHPYPENIFWELLDNLGLLRYNNRYFNEHKKEVMDILDKWMNREFARDGTGSIFPLIRPRRDQKKLCIWGQMNDYVHEKYS